MKKLYPHKCPRCNAPARNFGGLICSNTKCKSWSKLRKQAAEHKSVVIEHGLTMYDPITPMCPKCNVEARSLSAHGGANCPKCKEQFSFNFECHKWYRSVGYGIVNSYEERITQLDGTNQWNFNAQICRVMI